MSKRALFRGNLSLNVETVVTGPFQENSYIIWYAGSQDAVLIDPGDDEHLIIQKLENHNLEPIAIINTHAHLDHIGAVHSLKEKYQIPFYLHEKEKFILDTYEVTCRMFNMLPKETPEVNIWLKDDELMHEIKTLGDELDGPRGRIYLIQDMLENERKPSANVVKHIDRCLSCYSCMTTCPSNVTVSYTHLTLPTNREV